MTLSGDAGGDDISDAGSGAEEQEVGGEQGTGNVRPKLNPKERRRAGSAAIDKILEDARRDGIGPATESMKPKLFQEWEKSEKTIEAAKQMLQDAIKRRENAVVAIAQRMGSGPYRWRDKLYSLSANGNTVYLRELVPRAKE